MRSLHSYYIFIFALIVGILSFVIKVEAQSLTVVGGNITMTMTTGIAGGQLVNVVNTVTSLSFSKPTVPPAKITAVTSCPGQRFNLELLVINTTKGVSQPAIMLVNGSPAADIVRDIPKTGAKNGTCTLQYTASATFAQGNSTELGNDVHTVTFTIQAQ